MVQPSVLISLVQTISNGGMNTFYLQSLGKEASSGSSLPTGDPSQGPLPSGYPKSYYVNIKSQYLDSEFWNNFGSKLAAAGWLQQRESRGLTI
eukprot:719839-Amorphochlora_amoeboformis.AAC.2